MIEIDVQVPEGFEVVGYRPLVKGDWYLTGDGYPVHVTNDSIGTGLSHIVIKKIDDATTPWDKRLSAVSSVLENLCRLVSKLDERVAKMEGWCDEYDQSLSQLVSRQADQKRRCDNDRAVLTKRIDALAEQLGTKLQQSPFHGDAAGRD